jgi:hypothetical protein
LLIAVSALKYLESASWATRVRDTGA